MWQAFNALMRFYRLVGSEALNQAAYFSYFMEYTPVSAWITDAEGNMLYVNAAYYKMFAVPENILGKNIFDLYEHEVAAEYLRNIKHVFDTGEVLETIEKGEKDLKEKGSFWVYKFPILIQEQETLIGGIALDITTQLAAEAQQAELRTMREAAQLKEAFFASISHEMRNPLTSILLATGAIRRNLPANLEPRLLQTVEQYLEIITKECKSQVGLVSTLLQIQQIEAGVYPLNPLMLSLEDWLVDQLTGFEAKFKSKSLQVALDFHLGKSLVYTDAVGLNCILKELLQNAYKYTPQGGAITISTHGSEVSSTIFFTNTAPGLDPVLVQRLFEPFYRLPKAVREEGFGLGLNLGQTLASYLQGTLSVTSDTDSICFALTLPQAYQKKVKS